MMNRFEIEQVEESMFLVQASLRSDGSLVLTSFYCAINVCVSYDNETI